MSVIHHIQPFVDLWILLKSFCLESIKVVLCYYVYAFVFVLHIMHAWYLERPQGGVRSPEAKAAI